MVGNRLFRAYQRRVVYGFHGNAQSRIERLRANGYRRAVMNGDWLGAGMYFWQDAPIRAKLWADQVVARDNRRNGGNPHETPVVLLAELQLGSYFVDLIETGPWQERFRDAAAKLESAGLLPHQPKGIAASVVHERDCALIEFALDQAAQHGLRIDAIRCAFIEGQPLVEQSAIFDRSHVQIAVRNPKIINTMEEYSPA